MDGHVERVGEAEGRRDGKGAGGRGGDGPDRETGHTMTFVVSSATSGTWSAGVPADAPRTAKTSV